MYNMDANRKEFRCLLIVPVTFESPPETSADEDHMPENPRIHLLRSGTDFQTGPDDLHEQVRKENVMIQGMPERLKQLREESGLSQEELAQLVGKRKATISNYERGERTPVPEVIIKFSRIFRCSTDYILMGEGDDPVFLVEPLPDADPLKRITRIQNELTRLKEDVIRQRIE